MNINDIKKLRFVEGDLVVADYRNGAVWKAVRMDEKGVLVTLHSCDSILQSTIDSDNAIDPLRNSLLLKEIHPANSLYNPFGWTKATPKQIAEWRMDKPAQERDPSQKTDEAPNGSR